MMNTQCLEVLCKHLVVGGQGITHYYICELDYPSFCGRIKFSTENKDINNEEKESICGKQ